MLDFTNVSDADLEVMRTEVLLEGERRAALARMPAQIDALSAALLTAQGVKAGDAWRDPLTSGVPYPKGFTLTAGGKTWVSDKRMNLGAPGTAGWREVTTGKNA